MKQTKKYLILAILLSTFLSSLGSVGLNLLLIEIGFYPSQRPREAFVEFKYILFDRTNNSLYIEVIEKIWINGAPDFNNRPYKFRLGDTITIECPETILGAKFCFWQREELEPTFQGLILSNRTITIQLIESKTSYWANYVADLSSLVKG